MEPIIIVHGGAGDIPESRIDGKFTGVKLAVSIGHNILQSNGSALDAVEAAVVSMEKDEAFNAGYGSVLNLQGEVEMEASIMRGSDLNVGAVTLIKDFAHPISIAHKVLTDSTHSFLGGDGAKLFALEKGFQTVPPESLISPNAQIALEQFLKHREFGRTEIGKEDGVGTVGAVAVDNEGHVAVATSTGGMSGKAIGRIGDTPQIGSGTYADDNIGGVSTTGHGESILRYCLAHSIIRLMDSGYNAHDATKIAVEGLKPAASQAMSNYERTGHTVVRGTALYYRRSLHCGPINIPPLTNMEATGCRLAMTGHSTLVIVSVYLPSPKRLLGAT
ncbi:hypothetical protein EVAR_12878_1 [Eumeta japonica]|uniref:Uncharacterized protein n=1 Tax=Eumeta variegata TaxID=151549 RepID=A0A4C1TVQ6_EUMVA|nr:hypothetical protein EVAR_12878_1 [Eumeta japonica]